MTLGKKKKEGFEAKMKSVLFGTFHHLIEHNVCGQFVYIVFQSIEFLQMLAYVLHIGEHNHYHNHDSDYTLTTINYIRFINVSII